jgi:hypothetical protein
MAAAATFLVLRNQPGPNIAKPKGPGPPEHAPHAIVSLGDSTISGEGAGDYLPGTDGKGGDWCHRSPHAEVRQSSLPGIVKEINLACSGATAEDVEFGGAPHYTEGSQAAKLTGVAKKYRVETVVVAVGANDEPQFADTLTTCVLDWLEGTDCSAHLGRQWHHRVDAMVPKVAAALHDIRTAMHRAHYDRSDYTLVLQSYAAPLGPDVAPGLQNLSGCPIRTDDLKWIRDTGIEALDKGMHRAADAAGARFLNLARAGVGHEACSGGAEPGSEWFNRLTVDWHDLLKQKRAPHALQGSFHPNARGYHQFALCLDDFLATDRRAASCVPGPGGNLHAAPMPNKP